ncbi:LysM peptidoglycan-binding domain-containing protein [Amycolatopsis sp. SID8362]|uniref:CIS tube protein n=1 Tax=Amycolatopsis sp. SID8362 TaxID=2690346 RepID=UPI0013702CE0|nr:LysM peptidoglycan-binding domain-containing protein [Amycolatopsis sp. SID8362]NBH08771.1 LysM peptidoglycan-binding domain-containing protein [Amycolatopsis sp. SID8362]NED45464.1 LysM peptidoglycan-binding domain-containing protein [Amycolatopsis sp. SID8362]
MITTPFSSVSQGADAHLEIERPPNRTPQVIPLRFNPTEYKLSKSNTFAEITIPGLETPPLQFIRGGTETLTLQALVDTSDTLNDVRTSYVDAVRDLMRIDGTEHAPPIVRFHWNGPVFKGVLEKLDVNYVLFAKNGVPLRAQLDITLKEYRLAKDQAVDPPRSSPTVEKSYVVRRGDTWDRISAAVYRRPDAWRELARANGISDPRDLRPGLVLTVPRLP